MIYLPKNLCKHGVPLPSLSSLLDPWRRDAFTDADGYPRSRAKRLWPLRPSGVAMPCSEQGGHRGTRAGRKHEEREDQAMRHR